MPGPTGVAGPAFSLAARYQGDSDPSDLPGPGQYDVAAAGNTGAAFTMAGRAQAAPQQDTTPGPGAL